MESPFNHSRITVRQTVFYKIDHFRFESNLYSVPRVSFQADLDVTLVNKLLKRNKVIK